MTNQEKVKLHEYFCYLKETLRSLQVATLICLKIRDEEDLAVTTRVLGRWVSLMIKLDKVDDGEFFDERLNLKKEVDFFLEEMEFFGIPTPEKPAVF